MNERGPYHRHSVCFVAPKAYAALSGREDVAHVGGAERQQVLIARELARRGYAVSFVVLDHGQQDGENINGIKVFKCYRPDAGLRGVRFFHPRLSGLWSAMRRANADVYYQRGAESETGFVGNWCRRYRRGFVFAVAHDTNCLQVSPLMPRRSERWMFRHGLKRADGIVAQTSTQQKLLEENYHVSSTRIGSACDLSSQPSLPLGSRVLWVGRLSEEKRPEWLIRLATDLPEVTFDLVGQCNLKSTYGRDLMRQIEAASNIQSHGYIPHARMEPLYRSARLLLCTSESEGFPNVFLEAWAMGRPVLTCVDPDGVVAANGLGRVTTDYVAMRSELSRLDATADEWIEAGRRSREYVTKHHSIESAVDALEIVLQRAAFRLQA